MAMHLRKLQLKITTMRGLFGVNLEFDASGLNVIRAHNTSGKSTCVWFASGWYLRTIYRNTA